MQKDGNANQAHPGKILRNLRDKIGAKAFAEWGLGVLVSLQQKEILQSEVHGGRVQGKTKNRVGQLGNEPQQIKGIDSAGTMRGVWQTECDGCSPQGQQLQEQRTGEPGETLQELSQLKAQSAEILCNLWATSEGFRILQQALYSFQKIWGSTSLPYPTKEEVQSLWGLGTLERALWEALHAGKKSRPVMGYAVRRLLPIECERLMGLPDNWTNIPGASDTACYKAIGNSLAIPCPEWILGRIAQVIREKERLRGPSPAHPHGNNVTNQINNQG
ncbi:MAG: hypothetical protein VR68_11745 [Peptococcaceae bacterium BRH_c4a]|nr:MAG: hypothetical protein VR68_11745 [Peptococcaceae bacterium BRH_c4a]